MKTTTLSALLEYFRIIRLIYMDYWNFLKKMPLTEIHILYLFILIIIVQPPLHNKYGGIFMMFSKIKFI